MRGKANETVAKVFTSAATGDAGGRRPLLALTRFVECEELGSRFGSGLRGRDKLVARSACEAKTALVGSRSGRRGDGATNQKKLEKKRSPPE